MTERAVLAVSFGTSHRDTLEKNIAAIEAAVSYTHLTLPTILLV